MKGNPLKFIKEMIMKLILALGYEIREASPVDRLQWIKDLGIDTILDIGANTGQFAGFLRNHFPAARIFSFEPIPICYRNLCKAMSNDSRFQAFNLAVSDINGTVSFHLSSFSQSSSMLPMGQLHKDNFPFTAGEETITVESVRLDDFAKTIDLGEKLLVKIDVQGVEEKVIAGGIDTIRKADVLFLETNFQRLYKGQLLFKEILDIVSPLGFQYMGNVAGHLISPLNGICLEEDSIFVNRRLLDVEGNYQPGRTGP
jgi:FkbM family methyltransferase